MLLTIFSLDKQDLILGYLWLKDQNPEVNWEKEEVEMMYCPSRYKDCRDLQKVEVKEERVEEHTIGACQSISFSWILEEEEKPDITMECKKLGGEPGNRVFLTFIFPERLSANTQATATTS